MCVWVREYVCVAYHVHRLKVYYPYFTNEWNFSSFSIYFFCNKNTKRKEM